MDVSDEDDTWQRVEGVDDPADQIELDDLTLLAEVTHPIRSRILRRLKQPHTVAQVADALDVPVTRLYHHVNRLEELSLIRVVATRQVAAVTERRYQVAALNFGVSSELIESEDPTAVAQALGSIYDLAKLGMQREVERGMLSVSPDDALVSMGEVVLSPERRRELLDRLTGIITEFVSDADEADPTASRFTVFISAIPQSS